MTWLTLVRGGPFDTRGGGAMVFLSQQTIFFISETKQYIFFSCGSELWHETIHQFAELCIFFMCGENKLFFFALSAEQTFFCFFLFLFLNHSPPSIQWSTP